MWISGWWAGRDTAGRLIVQIMVIVMRRLLFLLALLFFGFGCGDALVSDKAQKSKQKAVPPPANSTGATSTRTDVPIYPPKKRRKRTRIELTRAAADQIKRTNRRTSAPYLRFGVDANCQYRLGFDKSANPKDDYVFQSMGVSIALDRKSAQLTPFGMVVDYFSENGRSGFLFNPPETDYGPPDSTKSLAEARKGFQTKLAQRHTANTEAPTPPRGVMRKISYPASPGKLVAYLTPAPKDGKKHPAIIWITGGDCNTIGKGCWTIGPVGNEQSASAYRKAGIVMMFPSQRGGNTNPGVKEGFFGEVDDIVSAAKYLRSQPYVDPNRVYLGGHSSGGTLALLTAEYSNGFRAVFSFGPVDDLALYPPDLRPFSLMNKNELRLRATVLWTHSISMPTFVFEGASGDIRALRNLASACKNPKVHFFGIQNASHFNILDPINRLIARRILLDTGSTCNINITKKEVAELFQSR